MADGYEVVVVGGGPAGVTAALRARELGASRRPGRAREHGRHLHQRRLRADPRPGPRRASRARRRAVRRLRPRRRAARGGLRPPAEPHPAHRLRGPGEKAAQSQAGDGRRRASSTAPAPPPSRTPHTLALGEGVDLKGERFVLCAGGHARRLGFPGSEHALTHSDVWTMRRLPRTVAVVGAAATGCQLASVFAAFGARVQLLEVAPRILRRRGRGRRRRAWRTRSGGAGSRSSQASTGSNASRRTRTSRLFYGQGGEARTLRTDAVVLAVGWPGNAERPGSGRRRASDGSAVTSGRRRLQDQRAARLRRRGHHGAYDARAERDLRGGAGGGERGARRRHAVTGTPSCRTEASPTPSTAAWA